MAAINYPVTGAPLPSPAPADGSVPLRLEIHDLQFNHPEKWTLYLLGLAAFQKQDETKDLSYYGVTGIHGRPYRPWGGVKGNTNADWEGYCTHSSILFAPWHRPYVALFEQILYSIIQKIAASFPETSRRKYQDAARDFRIPFWDWGARPAENDYFPNSVGKSPTVKIITPESNGKEVEVPNPLYSYHFNPLNPVKGDFPPDVHSQWTQTLRYPTSTTSANAKSQDNLVLQALESQFENIQSNVNLIMNDPNYRAFAAFSNHQWAPDAPGTYGSLENVHDSIHGEVGGPGGQMSDLDYAAFDPCFWLHHANVDRLFAIWQALNPTSYTIDQVDPRGTFTIAANTRETANTPLEPFKDTSGTKTWNSLGVRETETFGYAYPETQRWNFTSDSQYKTSVRVAVQQLYGGVSNQFLGQGNLNLKAAGPGSTSQKQSAQKPLKQESEPSKPAASTSQGDRIRGGDNFEAEIAEKAKDPKSLNEEPRSYTHYIVNIRALKHILSQTYRVHVFLGPFDNSTGTWHTQEALVGTFVVLGRTQDTGCGKCKQDKEDDLTITGTVPLTSALLKEFRNGNLGGMEKANVLTYLRDNLHWRVTLADGTEKPREEVPGLKVSVVSTEISLPADGLPVYSGVYDVHPECTEGRPAGHGAGDRC